MFLVSVSACRIASVLTHSGSQLISWSYSNLVAEVSALTRQQFQLVKKSRIEACYPLYPSGGWIAWRSCLGCGQLVSELMLSGTLPAGLPLGTLGCYVLTSLFSETFVSFSVTVVAVLTNARVCVT